MFLKIDVLKKISEVERKTPVLESLFNKVAGLKFFIIKILQHRCFPVHIAKFLRTAFLQNSSGNCF